MYSQCDHQIQTTDPILAHVMDTRVTLSLLVQITAALLPGSDVASVREHWLFNFKYENLITASSHHLITSLTPSTGVFPGVKVTRTNRLLTTSSLSTWNFKEIFKHKFTERLETFF